MNGKCWHCDSPSHDTADCSHRNSASVLKRRLERINVIACYASEEDTGSREQALLEIGKIARGESP